MAKLRMKFRKEARAAYISHLDLMRTFQRAFLRAGYVIKHSQGFHPHPLMSIVLPLPVGESSACELVDFEIEGETDCAVLTEKLNRAMPYGIRVEECYAAERPVRELAFLRAHVSFFYDAGTPANAAEALQELFAREELLVEKRTKHKELTEVNIRPMLINIAVAPCAKTVELLVTVQAQNPGLNPMLLKNVVERYAPELTPDHCAVHRLKLLDAAGEDFR